MSKNSVTVPMKNLIALLLLFSMLSCGTSSDQRLEVVKFDALEELMNRESESIEVINFWATWCKPCIAEIPYFQELHETDDRVKVTLVSLDFADEFDKKVIPFVKENGLTADIMLLDNIDYNAWIDKVDPSWSGAIPATLVVNHSTGERKFLEKELEEGEIQTIVEEIIN